MKDEYDFSKGERGRFIARVKHSNSPFISNLTSANLWKS